MIILFGPPGAGKSLQGQLLSKQKGLNWLSTGQLLRDSTDPHIHAIMATGELVGDEDMNRVIGEAIDKTPPEVDIILDGYPRKIEQAEWLLDKADQINRQVTAVISLEVSDEELVRRLHGRGRADDSSESIIRRSHLYRQKTRPVLDFFAKHKVRVATVNGEGSIENIQERIKQAFENAN